MNETNLMIGILYMKVIGHIVGKYGGNCIRNDFDLHENGMLHCF